MFGRLINVRIKAAEEALVAGRLEEALSVLGSGDLRGNRRAEELRVELGERILARGQDHLLGRRYSAALSDFDRASGCGVDGARLGEWRRRAMNAMQDDQKAGAGREAALRAARERLAAGSLAGAADALEAGAGEHADGVGIREAIERQAERARELVAGAIEAMEQGHLDRAARDLAKAEGLDRGAAGLADGVRRVIQEASRRAMEQFCAGKIDRAEEELAALGGLGRGKPEPSEVEDAIGMARDAAGALGQDDEGKAGMLLGRLAKACPGAKWVASAREQVEQLAEARGALVAGPLGAYLLRGSDGDQNRAGRAEETIPGGRAAVVPPVARVVLGNRAEAPEAGDRVKAREHGVGGSGAKLPSRMLLRIDGAGAYLLLTRDRVGIGRAGPGASADLQLISDLSEQAAEIIRAGEDYFVVSRSGVELAGAATEHALLQHGDRIRLGRRIRLTFGRPSLKTASATIDLGEGVRTVAECRRVILCAGPVLVGSSRESHIRVTGGSPAVLFERDGKMWFKASGSSSGAMALTMNGMVEVNGLRLSLSAADAA